MCEVPGSIPGWALFFFLMHHIPFDVHFALATSTTLS